MPVSIKRLAKIKTIDGFDQSGEVFAGNLVAIKDEVGTMWFGFEEPDSVELHTTVVCDNPNCIQGLVDMHMNTIPKTIQFDERGNGPEGDSVFQEQVAQLVTVLDINNQKIVFCCARCAGSFLSKVPRS